MVFCRLSQMREDRHRADERYRRITASQRRQNMGCGVQVASRTAVTRGHGALKKPSLMNSTNTGPGKLTGLIRNRSGFGNDAHGCVKGGGIIGHTNNGFLEVERRDHPLRGWMILVLKGTMDRSDRLAGLRSSRGGLLLCLFTFANTLADEGQDISSIVDGIIIVVVTTDRNQIGAEINIVENGVGDCAG